MKGIVNRLDTYGNSAAHYAKPYPDQSVAKLLLKHGAKIEINDQVWKVKYRAQEDNTAFTLFRV